MPGKEMEARRKGCDPNVGSNGSDGELIAAGTKMGKKGSGYCRTSHRIGPEI